MDTNPGGRPSEAKPTLRWSFGSASLDERSLELSLDGQPVDLERKPLEVLLHLLHHAGEVVTKDELIAAVWPGRILSDSVLTTCMAKLRTALRDEAQTIIKTAHGYGYRLVAEVTTEGVTADPPPRFDFEPGDHPRQRPLWSLVERLGTGGHGEVWRVQHDKTREVRVFKFALELRHLASLKREITLYRLLHDSLGDDAPFTRLLDWNLDDAPFFVELEHLPAGSLPHWARSKGGAAAVPPAVRLELAAQIAEALAAAHSIGVLHKDVKPSNVLIAEDAAGAPHVKLGDFGSGGVVDASRLEALGITRLGFTRTAGSDITTSGTPIYFPPEVIAGQPFTVRADVYAMGVLLYQLAVGDFGKPLAPGWEHDVDDELLREDIADAAAGSPTRRLADAATLARRLRSLEERRASRAAERAQSEKLQRAQRLQHDLKRLRYVLAGLVLVTTAAVAAGVFAYRARDEALAVSRFLADDVLGTANPNRSRLRDLTVKELLNRASSLVDERLADQPRAAAQVRRSLGISYSWLHERKQATQQLELAAAQYEALHGRRSLETLETLSQLALLYSDAGRTADARALLEEVVEGLERSWFAPQEARYELRSVVAKLRADEGDYDRALRDMRATLSDALNESPLYGRTLHYVRDGLARTLVSAGEFQEAEALYRTMLAEAEQASADRYTLAWIQLNHGRVLTTLGRYDEAEPRLLSALRGMQEWIGEDQLTYLGAYGALARLRLEQSRTDEALRILEDVIRRCVEPLCGDREAADGKVLLAKALQQSGRLRESAQTLREAVVVIERALGISHPSTTSARASLADVLREQGEVTQARAVLAAIPPAALARLPERHPTVAGVRRVQGLLLRTAAEPGAEAALREALEIYELRLGASHWLTRRARRELAAGER